MGTHDGTVDGHARSPLQVAKPAAPTVTERLPAGGGGAAPAAAAAPPRPRRAGFLPPQAPRRVQRRPSLGLRALAQTVDVGGGLEEAGDGVYTRGRPKQPMPSTVTETELPVTSAMRVAMAAPPED